MTREAIEKADKRMKYRAEVAPLLREFEAARAPHWVRFMNGEITHAEYRDLIAPATKIFTSKAEPIWVKHGGKPSK